MTSDDWAMLAEAELTHDADQAAYEVSKLTPRERSTPDTTNRAAEEWSRNERESAQEWAVYHSER